ncbi:MAG: hypothetical protein KatS3mg034_0058 [Vicingaceae bacterium]|nr:MAG: hypothetical protein KatS3mg034_0058 [Vicingaceae bacterium]
MILFAKCKLKNQKRSITDSYTRNLKKPSAKIDISQLKYFKTYGI